MLRPHSLTIVCLLSLVFSSLSIGNAQPASNDSEPKTQAVNTTGKIVEIAAPTPVATVQTSQYRVIGQDPGDVAKLSTIGELGKLDEINPYKMEAQISGFGASLWHVRLSDYTADVVPDYQEGTDKAEYRRSTAYSIQKATQVGAGGANAPFIFPNRPIDITLNNETIDLTYAGHSKWKKEAEGKYSILIQDKNGKPVLKIIRQYELAENSYLLVCKQAFQNLSGQEISFTWRQNGPLELAEGRASYVGDRREVAAGYFNPNHQAIRTDHTFFSRRHISAEEQSPVYHDNEDIPEGSKLKWLAFTNRYFAVAATRLKAGKMAEDKKANKDVIPTLTDIFAYTQCVPLGYLKNDRELPVLGYIFTSPNIKLPAGKTVHLDYSLYMGGRDPVIFSEEQYKDYAFANLLRYTMGGPCGFCTFQWLARGLLSTLRFFDTIFSDWGVAIILLVLCVRLCLHPITKKSQINMAKMGKQMQSLQPELEKLKKKYPDDKDKHKLSQEMMALYREKGVNPANFLGCLPMFLQMPIWIALYAMLYFAIELRHQHGFYGIFQWMGHATFLDDLAMPDRLWVFFDEPKTIKLLVINFDYSSLNILPLFMGIFWFYNQKLSTPKATTPEQAQQQKIMRYMTLSFPFFMYAAPSGLTLYIMSSSIAGVIDSLIVKRHIKREEEAGTLFNKKEKKPPKPGSLRHRLGTMMEAKKAELEQRMQAAQQAQQGKSGGGAGNRSMQRSMEARQRVKSKSKRKR